MIETNFLWYEPQRTNFQYLDHIKHLVWSTDGYRPYRVVHTGPSANRNANCPLLDGTSDWGCFCPVTKQNRSITIVGGGCPTVMVNFDRRRWISQPREKKEEGEEMGEPGV
ncbi:hypothetical protein GW17_00035389 [Ensete ventricosum]|nr:hypothetical protein GW17_00035389 [Ensete ventricosum]